jgi:hypothetical protein
MLRISLFCAVGNNMALKTGSGGATIDHKTIAAEGTARVQFAVAIALGIVLILLTITYVYLVINGRDAKSLLTLLGTLFGLGVGILTGRNT